MNVTSGAVKEKGREERCCRLPKFEQTTLPRHRDLRIGHLAFKLDFLMSMRVYRVNFLSKKKLEIWIEEYKL